MPLLYSCQGTIARTGKPARSVESTSKQVGPPAVSYYVAFDMIFCNKDQRALQRGPKQGMGSAPLTSWLKPSFNEKIPSRICRVTPTYSAGWSGTLSPNHGSCPLKRAGHFRDAKTNLLPSAGLSNIENPRHGSAWFQTGR